MALTLRRRAAPESLLDSSPRGEECAASKIPDTAPWRCFEALSGIRSRSPSACHSSANSARHLRATLLPANYSEPPHELLLPAHQQDPATWQLELLSAIGAPASAQVFSARICPRLVVFWAIAPSSAEINERAGRLARISHIYGDALAGHALFDPPSTQALEPPSNPSKLDPPSPLSIVTCQQLSTPTNLPSPPSLEASLKPSTLHPSPPLPCAPFRESLSLHPPPPPALCLASLLPYDVAERIFLALSFADLISCAAVCKAWRCHVSSNKVSAACPVPTPHSSFLAGPFVRAAEAGNLDACVIMARVMEARGEQQRALEWYRKAARMGHQGSQYRMGEAYYRGDGEWPRDEEEALAWLLRAARNAQADPVLGAAAAVSI
ncbi:unnamed protein product [Closterium sp. NIES-64]|nr:unnamed protein product [Closterium sp. NIES-64]CAI5988684.1 unnamed protein product [Closterium sp. NIES-64]